MRREDRDLAGKPRLSLDGWAVVVALVLAGMVRLGVVNRVPW